MTSPLIVGKNSYGSLEAASAYLGDSIRASSWADLDQDIQLKALYSATRLLEKQLWNGTKSALRVVTAVAIQAGGTGYAVGDELTVLGGTGEMAASAKVLTAPGGVVATVQLLDEGGYTADPTSPAATTGGAGTGCTLALTLATQTLTFPMTGLTDKYGTAVDGLTYPLPVQQAEYELAFELSLDSDLETAKGTGSNISAVHAGAVGVNYFRPTDTPGVDQRFPEIVQELIAPFIGGPSGPLSTVTGTDIESSFDGDDELTVTQGLP